MHFLNIVFLALGAHAVPGHLFTAERRDDDITLSGKEVNISDIVPFEPYPGYFKGQGAPSGSLLAIDACRLIRPDGDWLVKQATCNRASGRLNPFNADCAAKADHAKISTRPDNPCGQGQLCMEYHGVNQLHEGAWDVTCVSYQTLRQWVVNTTYNTQDPQCSPYFRNDIEEKKPVNISIQVNVLDSTKVERISPEKIYFQTDVDTNIGVERLWDGVVGSGIITVPHGQGVRACVKAIGGQIIWAYANIVGLTVLD